MLGSDLHLVVAATDVAKRMTGLPVLQIPRSSRGPINLIRHDLVTAQKPRQSKQAFVTLNLPALEESWRISAVLDWFARGSGK